VIDRYDVRHLLEDLTVLRRKKRAPPPPDSDYSDVTQEELDLERYRDLPSTYDDQGMQSVFDFILVFFTEENS